MKKGWYEKYFKKDDLGSCFPALDATWTSHIGPRVDVEGFPARLESVTCTAFSELYRSC